MRHSQFFFVNDDDNVVPLEELDILLDVATIVIPVPFLFFLVELVTFWVAGRRNPSVMPKVLYCTVVTHEDRLPTIAVPLCDLDVTVES